MEHYFSIELEYDEINILTEALSLLKHEEKLISRKMKIEALKDSIYQQTYLEMLQAAKELAKKEADEQ